MTLSHKLSLRLGTLALSLLAVSGWTQTVLYQQEGSSSIRLQQLDTGTWTGVAAGEDPVVNADRTKIAFSGHWGDDNYWRILVANIDGSDRHPVSPPLGIDSVQPCWSPDGQRLAFVLRYPSTSYKPDIWTVNADGTNPRQVTSGELNDEHPAWSPDGEWIAFERWGPIPGVSTIDVMLVRPDGSDLRTFAQGFVAPEWLPDGRGLGAVTDHEASIVIFGLDGQPLATVGTDGRASTFSFSSDRSRVLYYSYGTATEGAQWIDGGWFGYRGGVSPSCPIFEPGTVHPYRLECVEGEPDSLALSSLFAVGGESARVFSDSLTLGACLEVEGLCTMSNPSSLRLQLTANVPRLGLSQQVRVYDYVADRFVVMDGRVAPLEPASLDIELTGLKTRVVNQDRHMRARIAWSPLNDEAPAQDGWPHQLDQCSWQVN